MSFWDRFKKTPPKVEVPALSLSEIAARLQAFSTHGVLSAADLDTRSAELGIPRELAYAALATSEATGLRKEHDTQFVVCTGNCRDRGALACLQRLLELRDARLAAGQSAFDLVPRQCLGRCQVAPAIEICTRNGTAVLTSATPASVSEAVSELFES